MESVLDTPPSEENVGEMCFGECKDKVDKLKKDFLMLKRKIFCSQDLIQKYNNKVNENEQMSRDMRTLQVQLKSMETKLNKRNIALQSDTVRLQLENEKLRKTNEDVTKLREEYEIRIAGDKQYTQQLVCKLKEIEDQNLDKLMKIELEKSGLQGKVKELEREIRNLRKNSGKADSLSSNKTNEPKKRGRKSVNNQKTVDLPIIENDLDCTDIDENVSKPLISECNDLILQEECKVSNLPNIQVQKPQEMLSENEVKINVSSIEEKLPQKPICIDKNIMTDEYYDFSNDPYPLYCHKCRSLLNSKPVDEILNGMQIKPLITELARSPVHERNEKSPVIHANISMNVKTLAEKLKKLQKQVSRMKQAQNSYKNVSHCSRSHINNCCRDNSMNDSFSLMNMMTTFFNAMQSNKKKKKSRAKRLQHRRKKIYRNINNHTDNNWDVETLSYNLNDAENSDVDLESLDVPLFTPLIKRTKKHCSLNYSTSKNYVQTSKEINDHQIGVCSDIEIKKVKKIPKKTKKQRKTNNSSTKYKKNNDDSPEYQKYNNDHTDNHQDDNVIVNHGTENSEIITNIEKTLNLNLSIDDSENDQTENTEQVNEIIPNEEPINKIRHAEKHFNYDVNTRLSEMYSPDATVIGLISPPKLNTVPIQKRKKGRSNTNTVSVKSNLLTRLRQLKSKSTNLPAKIFRNENLDKVQFTEDLGGTPIKKRRIAHVPKQECLDDGNDNLIGRSHEEQLSPNRLRVTRSMVKSSLLPNISLGKESQNSVTSGENLITNNTTNAMNDDHSFEREHYKNNDHSVIYKNQTALNPVVDIDEKIHSKDQEIKHSDKTQGLNDRCGNKKSNKISKLDNNKKRKTIDFEQLFGLETNKEIDLKNNPELADESSVLSDPKLTEFSVLLEQEETSASSQPEIGKTPVSPQPEIGESLVSPEPEIGESLVLSEPEIEEAPTSPQLEIEEFPTSPQLEIRESPASPQLEIRESPASPQPEIRESPASPQPEIGESPASPEPEIGESPASPEPEIGESPASPELVIGESPASPEPEIGESPASPEPEIGESPASHIISDTANISATLSKKPRSKDEFYKDCVINLRNRTVAINSQKIPHDSNNKSCLQNKSSKSLLDQHLMQKKFKVTRKWSKFHQDAAMKLAKGAEEYVKMELKNLIDAEAWTTLENEKIVNNLKTINNRSIAKSVVEFLIELSDLKEPLDRTFTPPAPMMTKKQQKIVALLKKLDGFKNIIIDILNTIEYAIFNMSFNVTYEAAEELARIFTVLAKIKKDRERVRIMCCDALYCLQKKGLFIIYSIITSWPEVLPFYQEDRFQYLPACIAYAVKTYKHAPNDVCAKIIQLNKLIRSLYKYPDEFLTSKSFIEKLLTDLMTPRHDRSVPTAIILLSKKEGCEWTYENIISGGLLGMIVENKSSDVREALKLLGHLMKSFPIADRSGNVRKIIDQLCAILDSGAIKTDIQEGVVFALLSLSRHNFNRVAESISKWQPPQNLSSELEEQLNIFFNLRTLNFWKQFKKKRKI